MKTGKQLLETIHGHPEKKKCPHCKEEISRVALVDLVYAFESCDCDAAHYVHLTKTIYHRDCYVREAFLMPPVAT